jgi:predicted dehydrogenase
MKQLLLRRGRISIEDVPAPLLEPGTVLVEVAFSLISPGTETANVKTSGKSVAQRAIERPDLVRQVVDHLRRQGLSKTVARVRGQLDAGTPMGYSCSGIAVQVAAGVEGVRPGDTVACGGGGYAVHAEVVVVPRNLIVRVPPVVELRDASSVTLGAIALQGVRRTEPRLGEIVAVIGLGLLGQLSAQLLKAAGCRVIGIDIDPQRVALAKSMGIDHAIVADSVVVAADVAAWTSGHGVDATIITAASDSDKIVQQAMELTRKKGRVVVVGAVGMNLERSPFYEKEIDFLISCSYGPGRYDERYEEAGLDYPYAFVRWTENRNMAEYLRLVAEKRVRLGELITREVGFEQADEAYASLSAQGSRPLAVALRYGDRPVDNARSRDVKSTPPRRQKKCLRLALIGAGAFAKSVHLPNLQTFGEAALLRTVVSASAANAASTARLFGAERSSTSFDDVLKDPEVDAVLICTRHHLHAEQITRALRAGKHVYCEKPMTLSEAELRSVLNFYDLDDDASDADIDAASVGRPVLMVGYNRRFSPAATRVRAAVQGRRDPLFVLYRVNAGWLPPSSWVYGAEGGGRILGEMCHMFDLFDDWVDSPILSVSAEALSPTSDRVLAGDNVAVTVGYLDGSLCTLLYTSLGSSALAKEYIEAHADGRSYLVDDFQKLTVFGAKLGWRGAVVDKGHGDALRAFVDAASGRRAPPIALSSLRRTASLAHRVARTVGGGSAPTEPFLAARAAKKDEGVDAPGG